MVADDSLLPWKGEIQYLTSRVEAELDRSSEASEGRGHCRIRGGLEHLPVH